MGCLLLSVTAGCQVFAGDQDFRGVQFVGFTNFESFERKTNAAANVVELLSPWIKPQIAPDELIVSWNATAPPGTFVEFDARVEARNHVTKYFSMGHWASGSQTNLRTSVPAQADDDGDVKTDTLVLKHSAGKIQLRVTLHGTDSALPSLQFLALSLTDTHASAPALAPERRAWGRVLDVPERSQMDYENGGVLCSPTTVSMLLSYWAAKLNRPELACDVPEVAANVFDTNWDGTGNWVFNTAYAGSFPGMRAFTTRFTDLAELEAWIERGFPVGLSLCYNRLRGVGLIPSGHLVVCVGFTKDGDPILNDPGTRNNVRKTFPRARLLDAWSYSRNTVYLVFPVTAQLPEDRFGHWTWK